jgi:hypothetical protein
MCSSSRGPIDASRVAYQAANPALNKVGEAPEGPELLVAPRVMTAKPSRLTARQWAAGKALAVQLLLVIVTTALAAAYAVSEAGWIPPLATAALIATIISAVITFWRTRAETLEREDVERSLSRLQERGE